MSAAVIEEDSIDNCLVMLAVFAKGESDQMSVKISLMSCMFKDTYFVQQQTECGMLYLFLLACGWRIVGVPEINSGFVNLKDKDARFPDVTGFFFFFFSFSDVGFFFSVHMC